MAFNQNSFVNFSNNDIVEFINTINQGLNEYLEIANTSIYRGGAKKQNIKTLYTYLNHKGTQRRVRNEVLRYKLINNLNKLISQSN